MEMQAEGDGNAQGTGGTSGGGRDLSKSAPTRRSFVDRASYWAAFDEEKKRYFHFFEVIDSVQAGAMMKIKVGVAGDNPNQDSFPMFRSSKCWMMIYWNVRVSQDHWSVVLFDDELDVEDSTTLTTRQINAASKVIPLRDITEVYLDPKSVTSFRIYREKEAIQCSPTSPMVLASSWADAIYSVLQLQSTIDLEDLQEVFEDYRTLMKDLIAEEKASNPDGLFDSRLPSLHPDPQLNNANQANGLNNPDSSNDKEDNENKGTDEDRATATVAADKADVEGGVPVRMADNVTMLTNRKKSKRVSLLDSMRSTFFSSSSQQEVDISSAIGNNSSTSGPPSPTNREAKEVNGSEQNSQTAKSHVDGDATTMQSSKGSPSHAVSKDGNKRSALRRWTSFNSSGNASASEGVSANDLSSPPSSPGKDLANGKGGRDPKKKIAKRMSLLPFTSAGVLPSERQLGVKLMMEDEIALNCPQRASLMSSPRDRDSILQADPDLARFARAKRSPSLATITSEVDSRTDGLPSEHEVQKLNSDENGIHLETRGEKVVVETTVAAEKDNAEGRQDSSDAAVYPRAAGSIRPFAAPVTEDMDKSRSAVTRGDALKSSLRSSSVNYSRSNSFRDPTGDSLSHRNSPRDEGGREKKESFMQSLLHTISSVTEKRSNTRPRSVSWQEHYSGSDTHPERTSNREEVHSDSKSSSHIQSRGRRRATAQKNLIANRAPAFEDSDDEHIVRSHDSTQQSHSRVTTSLSPVGESPIEPSSQLVSSESLQLQDVDQHSEKNPILSPLNKNEKSKSEPETKSPAQELGRVTVLDTLFALQKEEAESQSQSADDRRERERDQMHDELALIAKYRRKQEWSASHQEFKNIRDEEEIDCDDYNLIEDTANLAELRARSPSPSRERLRISASIMQDLVRAHDARRATRQHQRRRKKSRNTEEDSSNKPCQSSSRRTNAANDSGDRGDNRYRAVTSSAIHNASGRSRSASPTKKVSLVEPTSLFSRFHSKGSVSFKEQSDHEPESESKVQLSLFDTLVARVRQSASASTKSSPLKASVSAATNKLHSNQSLQYRQNGSESQLGNSNNSSSRPFTDQSRGAVADSQRSPAIVTKSDRPLTAPLGTVPNQTEMKEEMLNQRKPLRTVSRITAARDTNRDTDNAKYSPQSQQLALTLEDLQIVSPNKSETETHPPLPLTRKRSIVGPIGESMHSLHSVPPTVSPKHSPAAKERLNNENAYSEFAVIDSPFAVSAVFDDSVPVQLSIVSREHLKEILLTCDFPEVTSSDVKHNSSIDESGRAPCSYEYITNCMGVTCDEDNLISNIPQARQFVVLTMCAIISEMLDSSNYLQVLYCDAISGFHELVYLPIQGLVRIDVSKEDSSLFRFLMSVSSAQYPVLHTKNIFGSNVFKDFLALDSSQPSKQQLSEYSFRLVNADDSSRLRSWLQLVSMLRDDVDYFDSDGSI